MMIRRGIVATGAAIAALVLGARASHAQGRYRVVVGGAGGATAMVVEFQPCVPAEGSDCGARVERVVDTRTDSVVRAVPAITTRAALWSGADSLVIVGGALTTKSSSPPRTPVRAGAAKLHPLRDGRGAFTAIAVAPSAPYAFLIVSSRGVTPDFAVMYDATTNSIIASCALPNRATGVAMAP